MNVSGRLRVVYCDVYYRCRITRNQLHYHHETFAIDGQWFYDHAIKFASSTGNGVRCEVCCECDTC